MLYFPLYFHLLLLMELMIVRAHRSERCHISGQQHLMADTASVAVVGPDPGRVVQEIGASSVGRAGDRGAAFGTPNGLKAPVEDRHGS